MSFRVLLCVAPETSVLKAIDWNGGFKIRLAIWPLAARWSRELLLPMDDEAMRRFNGSTNHTMV